MSMPNKPKLSKNNLLMRSPLAWLLWILLLGMIINAVNNISITGVPKEITYSQLFHILKDKPESIKQATKTETILRGEFSDNSKSTHYSEISLPSIYRDFQTADY